MSDDGGGTALWAERMIPRDENTVPYRFLPQYQSTKVYFVNHSFIVHMVLPAPGDVLIRLFGKNLENELLYEKGIILICISLEKQ